MYSCFVNGKTKAQKLQGKEMVVAPNEDFMERAFGALYSITPGREGLRILSS
jgi:hypothetical protein